MTEIEERSPRLPPGCVLGAEKLPSLPAVALEVVALVKKDGLELRELAETVGRDPALSGRVLKLANSPLYARTRRIATLNEAVMTLGLNAVKMAALGFSVVGAVGTAGKFGGYELKAFWRRTLIQSVGARTFAKDLGLPFAEEAFACGLLMDIAIPVLARTSSEYRPVVALMDGGHPDCATERTHVGTDHAELAGTLMEHWGLPADVAAAVSWHHEPLRIPPEAGELAALIAKILHVGHLCATVMTSSAKAAALVELEGAMAGWFGRDAAATDAFLRSLAPSVAQLAEIVNVDIGGEVNAEELLDAARAELVAASMQAAGDLHVARGKVVELETKASTDALTGLANRASFDAALAREWDRRAADEFEPLGLIMIDVDHFKRFNDRFGHPVGDDVLRRVAAAIKACARKVDLACRYGGEEFVMIAGGASGLQLRAFAERLRRAVAAVSIPTPDGPQGVTASFGTAALVGAPGGGKPEDLVAQADKCLYEAKRAGRNRVVCGPDL